MKQRFLLLVFLFSYVTVQAAPNADSLWMYRNYTKIEQYITMRDGTRLFTSIYVPDDNSEDHPILMTRTPYSCAPYGKDNFRDFWDTYQMAYLRQGYIMVIQDVRGKWMSEGDYMNIRPIKKNKTNNKDIDELTDSYDTIDWLVKYLPHNNGKVGAFGISYPGFYALMAAACGHPAMVASSPQAPVIDWFVGDDDHHNGAFFVMDEFDYDVALGQAFGVPHRQPTAVAPRAAGYPIHDNYKFYLKNQPLSALTRLTGDTISFWNDLFAHPDYDDWWKERDARLATKNLKPAMLWVGGLFDAEDNWGAWNGYLAAEQNNKGKTFNKLVMGPWYHEQWANNDGTHLGNINYGSNTSQWYQQNIEIPFFNYFLKGQGDSLNIAEATVFMTGANKWATFPQWQPAKAQKRKLYLQPDESLAWTQPRASGPSASEYISDPKHPVPYAAEIHFNRTRKYMTDDQRFAERRPDVLSFSTPVLDSDVTVTGNILASLQTSISTTDADFVVKLIDVYPDTGSYNNVNIYDDPDPVYNYPMGGYEMLVHAEIMRGKYRNSLEKPVPFVPNQITPVSYKLGDVAHTFKRGHRIMVQIQSSWFPLVDLNPQQFENIYQAKKEDFRKSTIRIFHDKAHPSFIELPVLMP